MTTQEQPPKQEQKQTIEQEQKQIENSGIFLPQNLAFIQELTNPQTDVVRVSSKYGLVTEKECNERGAIIRKVSSYEGVVGHEVFYNYNDKGQIHEIHVHDKNSGSHSIYNVNYRENGLVTIVNIDDSTQTMVGIGYTFDEQGRLLSARSHKSTIYGRPVESSLYTYHRDEQGRILSVELFDNGDLNSTITFVYGQDGSLVSVTKEHSKSTEQYHITDITADAMNFVYVRNGEEINKQRLSFSDSGDLLVHEFTDLDTGKSKVIARNTIEYRN